MLSPYFKYFKKGLKKVLKWLKKLEVSFQQTS
jgi:hypothetical protein